MILTHNISEGAWNYFMRSESQGGWDMKADELSRLRIFKNVYNFSHYVDLYDKHSPHSSSVDLAEMRYGRIIGTLNSIPSLFLILKFRHNGQGTESYIKPMPSGWHVAIGLLTDRGDLHPLIEGFANGINCLWSDVGFETWVVVGIVYSELPNFDLMCSEPVPENASLFVSVRDRHGQHPDPRVHAAWKSGEAATGVPYRDASGYAFTT